MFLEKKLMVIPIKNQYEQYCNAAALKEMGVPVRNRIDQGFIPEVRSWLNSPKKSPVLRNAADMSQLADELLYLSRPQSRSEEHTSELQSRGHLVCRLLLEKK